MNALQAMKKEQNLLFEDNILKIKIRKVNDIYNHLYWLYIWQNYLN